MCPQKDFIAEHFGSLDDLHVFILVSAHPDQWWDARTIAERLSVDVEVVRRALDRFVSDNLFDVRVLDDFRYRYEPGNAALGAEADALIDAFRRAPAVILKQVRAGRRRAIEDFADAFRFVRHDDR